MTAATFNFLLNHSYAALIVFTATAALTIGLTRSFLWRAAAGIAGVLISLCVPFLGRSLFEWVVSAVERPSLPGFLLLVILAISATTGRHLWPSAEFRFATSMVALAGFVLYPASVGFLDYDTYTLGYGGYSLPIAIALVLAYAVYRGYFLTALALNAAIGLFLLGAGWSLNLWDYIIDPVAWIAAIGAWVGVVGRSLMVRNSRKAIA
jgi:hypothetical protein